MASPSEGGAVACPCGSCMGLKVLNKRTVRKHLEKEDNSSRKKQKTIKEYEEEDRLHKGTEVTGFQLCLRVLALYNSYSGVTQQCVDDILHLISDVLGNLTDTDKIPWDFKTLNTFMSNFMTPVKRYTACPNECRLFEGNSHSCTLDTCKDTVSKKTYHYIPLIDRLKQLYANPEIAKHLQSHHSISTEGEVSDIQHSDAWEAIYGRGGQFEDDERAICLEFSSDGFSPFHHSTSKPYSIEQQASIVLNLPPALRTKPGFVLLHGLIPGPQAPKSEKFNVYLKPLVDELLELARGVDNVFDAHKKETFTLRATILLHVHDFPGQAKVFHGLGSGAKFACPMCKSQGTYSCFLHKMVYRSGREFLEADDPLRFDTTFPGGEEELGKPILRNFSEETILAATSGVLEVAVQKSIPRSQARRAAKAAHTAVMSDGCRKRCSEFDRLGDREAGKIAVEGMHTIQGVAKNLHGILNGHRDSVGVRAHEAALNRFPGCEADERGRLPDAPFTLTKHNMNVADERIASVDIPGGKGSLPTAVFGNFHSMKSHTWHLLMTKGIYLYALNGLLGKDQMYALIMFVHIMAICSARCIYRDLLPKMKRHLHRSMTIMDREFPETLKTILWHMLHHLPMFVERFGPMHSYWMFYFERQIHYHVSRLHNSKHPEAAMINSYRADAMCTLMEFTDIGRSQLKNKERRTKSTGQMNSKDGEHGKWYWRGGEYNGSIVYQRDESGNVFFGRIMFFYEFDYQGRNNKYASVHWFGQPTEDDNTRLLSCRTHTRDTSLNPAVPVEQLSEPLITATENGTIFILDFLDGKRVGDLLDWMESL